MSTFLPGRLRQFLTGLALAGAVAFVPAGAQAQVDSSPASGAQPACSEAFKMTVRQGPSQDLHLEGILALQADSMGVLTGGLFDSQNTPVGITGQVTGRGISLLFRLQDGRNVYGVGVLERDFAECGGALGGPFVGPEEGDPGDWAVVCLVNCGHPSASNVSPIPIAPVVPDYCGSKMDINAPFGPITVPGGISLGAASGAQHTGNTVSATILVSCSVAKNVRVGVRADGVSGQISIPAAGNPGAACTGQPVPQPSSGCVSFYQASAELPVEYAGSQCVYVQALADTPAGIIRSPTQTACR